MRNIIEQNLLDIKREIEPYRPNIIAVTKYFNHEAIIDAYQAGLRDFGENRVIDAVAKISLLSDEIRQNSRFHLIGHLQSNKVKKAVGNFDLIHSVDSLELAETINQEAEKRGIIQHVLLQVNNAGEEQKSGFEPVVLIDCFEKILELKNIKVDGLMNMAPLIEDKIELKRLFDDIAVLKNTLEDKYGYKMDELSMGMSGDYAVAVASGATMIRIGRKLFTDKV